MRTGFLAEETERRLPRSLILASIEEMVNMEMKAPERQAIAMRE